MADAGSDDWYWHLKHQRAVPAAERGADDEVLGPYPTRAHAENWRQQSERRNDAWDDADDEWNEWSNDRA